MFENNFDFISRMSENQTARYLYFYAHVYFYYSFFSKGMYFG